MNALEGRSIPQKCISTISQPLSVDYGRSVSHTQHVINSNTHRFSREIQWLDYETPKI